MLHDAYLNDVNIYGKGGGVYTEESSGKEAIGPPTKTDDRSNKICGSFFRF